MVRALVLIALAASSSAAFAAERTNWGIRPVPGEGPIVVPPKTPYVDPALRPTETAVVTTVGRSSVSMSSISRIGAKWGRVTSTYRSPAHNRRVGGVPNSFHLSGRAIDIARRPGVSHWQIAADLRAAGYNLIESLDEGDHSHFAFGGPGESKRAPARLYAKPAYQMVTTNSPTRWRVVYAPGSGGGN